MSSWSPGARLRGFAAFALACALVALAAPVAAQSTFVARTDRQEMSLGDVLVLEVTLSLSEGRADGYMPPDFNGFRILGEYPSQSTQIQMGGGGSFTRHVYSWRYELSPTRSGRLVIAPAKIRAGGREMRTTPIAINVQSGALEPSARASDPQRAAPPAPRRRQRRIPPLGSPFDDLFGGPDPVAEPQPSAGRSFIRVAADKPRAYVGEQIVVEWSLFLAERQDKYQAITEARTDGFWSEDLAGVGGQGSLSLTQQSHEGRDYLVAPLQKRALFPLQAGSLTITPLESEISQVDFFGRQARTQRLKADPLTIEVLPLPPAGRPANFDPAAVGRFTIEARLDRNEVNVGEPVSLTVTIAGQGNLRKLAPPRTPVLDGWKIYEPKTDVKIENQGGISGRKTVEYLMQPERPGATIVPAFELGYFDPSQRKYLVEKSLPLKIVVKGEPLAAVRPGATSAPAAGGAIENVIGAELRPPRSTAKLGRSLGETFYRSRLFTWAVVLPPVAFALTVIIGRMRARFARDTEGARRRKSRRRVRHHLRAAEKAQDAGSPSGFYAEIDRVLRELISVRLGQPIAGMSRDELLALLGQSGLAAPVPDRILALLDECDRARFAPGSIGPAELGAALERAEEFIPLIEKPGKAGRPVAGASGRLALSLLFVLGVGLMEAPAMADGIDEAWKRGNDAYFRGDYPAAIAAFTELDRQGIVSADLFVNLGLAYYRQGQLGRSIWAFERAVSIDPDADDARFNLAQIRRLNERRAVDKIEGAENDPFWIRMVTALPTATETWLFIGLWVALFGVLFWRRTAADDLKAPLGAFAALLGLGAALAGLVLLGRSALDRIPFGIVLPEEVAVKEGADPNYRTSFQIHAGLKVRLLDRDHDWVRIRLPNGLEGWVRDVSVGRL